MSKNSPTTAFEVYQSWLDDPAIDPQSKDELKAISGDEAEIEDRFFMELQFGTAGLRGILGIGSNRMNRYNVAKATQGYADTLLTIEGASRRGVAISYDSRRFSEEFALETALVLCGNGIKCYLSDEMRSVPQLSFAIGHYNCAGGVVITASHNPKQYNGYKVFGENGAQLGPEIATSVTEAITAVPSFGAVKRVSEQEALDSGLLHYIGEEWDEAYFAYTKSLAINPALFESFSNVPIVYTPLHGCGARPIPRILRELGLNSLTVVESQSQKDYDFSTVSAPNPEAPDAFDHAIQTAKQTGAKLLLATDPDGDRLGVAVWDETAGKFIPMTGNQLGCLMLHYRLSQQKELGILPDNPIVVRSLVSTDMSDKISRDFGAELVEVLTGFRYIGEIVADSAEGKGGSFVFGFEESFGYLSGLKVRDKDAILAAMIIAETAAYYQKRGMSLLDAIDELYQKYGYYHDAVESYSLTGKAGMETIQNTMVSLRNEKIASLSQVRVVAVRDYLSSVRETADGVQEPIDLPKSDVLYYELEDGSWFCIRPSGTEPKLKLYISALSDDSNRARAKADEYLGAISSVLNPLLGI